MANDGPIEVSQRARTMLADAYEQAGHPDEAAAFRAGDWTCHDHPALVAMKATRDDALEQAAKVADARAELLANIEGAAASIYVRASELTSAAAAIRALKGVEG